MVRMEQRVEEYNAWGNNQVPVLQETNAEKNQDIYSTPKTVNCLPFAVTQFISYKFHV